MASVLNCSTLNWVFAMSASFGWVRLAGRAGLDVCGGVLLVGEGPVARPERLVDLEQRLLLPLREPRVAEDRELDGTHLVVVRAEDPGLDVDLLRRDPQRLGQRLEDLRRRPAKSTL